MLGRGLAFCATALIVLSTPAASNTDPSQVPSQNKAVVLDYLDLMITKRRVAEAMQRYVAPDYIQHNPKMPAGRAASTAALEALSKSLPQLTIEVKRAIAEGDMVVVHSFGRRHSADRGVAIVDIYRLRGGLIVEHWDVIQDVPEKPMNANTMF